MTAVAPAPAPGPASAPLLAPGRTRVVGVVNTTPDSFSDGGRWLEPDAAVAHGRALLAEGADLLDVGGESTRPGAQRVAEAEELRRVLPVVSGLAAAGAVVSIDTMRASVALAAVEAGARVVNDVSGGLADPELLPAVAGTDAVLVLSHWRGHSARMRELAVYDDVVAEVRGALAERAAAAQEAGVPRERLVVDPGLGFAKDGEHDWALLAALPALVADGLPVLVGASRKRFLGALLGGAPATGRDAATAAVSALAAAAGAWGVRVHAVRASADAVRVAQRWGQG